jgi:DMSO/TMAO reductase YedYZ molybdopterin-dependent catalytic subunit
VALGGRVRRPQTLRAAALSPLVRPMGAHLLECAGNTNPNNYGLISAARWDGVPLGALLDRAAVPDSAYVRVSGVDDEQSPSRTSTPGATWIFGRQDLERTGAFLATRMNGDPLSRHHGAPARLVVPGWYACACIKWVARIDVVPHDAPPTSQMLEFAARTHQPRDARLAREFMPAAIDVAALPVRVEQWNLEGRRVYRIVGIVWGGTAAANALQIRFRTGDDWADVDDCPPRPTAATWGVWSHAWRPSEAGRYAIVLRVKDPAVRTRRLDVSFYVRSVDITDV